MFGMGTGGTLSLQSPKAGVRELVGPDQTFVGGGLLRTLVGKQTLVLKEQRIGIERATSLRLRALKRKNTD